MAMVEIFYKLNRAKFHLSNNHSSFINHQNQSIEVINFYFISERLKASHLQFAGSTIVVGYDLKIMTHHSKRYVALKVVYFG
ncbi:hypothetical protein ES332_D02G184600v1 [Gossypium tomentosum]|uniref:Uncharacterized protein n=1 Tax=Gossypium tomentosum TaxID=34277 RepID=A0A5D2LZ01_GOSTO|nr:hypothetical protein ES332_D02G184600v1 [Gossypium tomentosum]